MTIRAFHFILGALLLWGWVGLEKVGASDLLLDFSIVKPPALEDRVIKSPLMSWEVEADLSQVEERCGELTGFDGGVLWREGCVAWSVDASRCTMVTTKSTSHSLMGRLFLMCTQAREQLQ